jgi:sugar-specific transcriptional regulator TrmB
MQEDLVVKLTNFGFTVNQAKVYLSIVQSGRTRVERIAKNTQLHRQDIYKLLPKLEKMGLIVKSIEKPFSIEALPIKDGLGTIIFKEKEKAKRKIAYLERNLKEIIDLVQTQPQLKEEARFTLLTTDQAILNKGRISFGQPRKKILIVGTVDYITTLVLHDLRVYLQTIGDGNAKTWLVLVGSQDEKIVKRIVEKIVPAKGQFKAKWISKSVCKNYQVIDNEEVWISTQQSTKKGYPCFLWTNDQNIICTYSEHFKEIWNSSKAVTIYDSDKANEDLTPRTEHEKVIAKTLFG